MPESSPLSCPKGEPIPRQDSPALNDRRKPRFGPKIPVVFGGAPKKGVRFARLTLNGTKLTSESSDLSSNVKSKPCGPRVRACITPSTGRGHALSGPRPTSTSGDPLSRGAGWKACVFSDRKGRYLGFFPLPVRFGAAPRQGVRFARLTLNGSKLTSESSDLSSNVKSKPCGPRVRACITPSTGRGHAPAWDLLPFLEVEAHAHHEAPAHRNERWRTPRRPLAGLYERRENRNASLRMGSRCNRDVARKNDPVNLPSPFFFVQLGRAFPVRREPVRKGRERGGRIENAEA